MNVNVDLGVFLSILIPIILSVVGGIVWLIRLEGSVRMLNKDQEDNKDSIKRLYDRTNDMNQSINSHKVEVGVMTEAMKHINSSLSEIKAMLKGNSE